MNLDEAHGKWNERGRYKSDHLLTSQESPAVPNGHRQTLVSAESGTQVPPFRHVTASQMCELHSPVMRQHRDRLWQLGIIILILIITVYKDPIGKYPSGCMF